MLTREMAAEKKSEVAGGATLEMHGDGQRVLGAELYRFMELGAVGCNWKKEVCRASSGDDVLRYRQESQPFFSGDDLTHEEFFTLCTAFSEMICRLNRLCRAKRKSVLQNALAPQFSSECVPFGKSCATQLCGVKKGTENEGNGGSRRISHTKVQPGLVWSPILNPLRSLTEWTYGACEVLKFEWVEQLSADCERWTFACKPKRAGFVQEIRGEFWLGAEPALRIAIDMDLSPVDGVEDGYLIKRKDIVLTALNQHQAAVYAYFVSMFDHISEQTGGIFASLLGDRYGGQKKD